MPRFCLRDPIPEIEIAATHLNNAVSAHLNKDRETAEHLLHLANNKTIWLWTDSVWGKQTSYNTPHQITPNPPVLPPSERAKPRDATPETKRQIHERDGHYCRFCKIPVIRPAIRTAIHKQYPNAVPWGPSNTTQHAAFQCLWAQYDHIIPHARGGQSTLENMSSPAPPAITAAATTSSKTSTSPTQTSTHPAPAHGTASAASANPHSRAGEPETSPPRRPHANRTLVARNPHPCYTPPTQPEPPP